MRPGSGTSWVHMYETIDYEIVAASVSPALEDFGAFLDRYRRRLANWEERVPRLSAEEAEALGRDVHEARDSLPELGDEDPWES